MQLAAPNQQLGRRMPPMQLTAPNQQPKVWQPKSTGGVPGRTRRWGTAAAALSSLQGGTGQGGAGAGQGKAVQEGGLGNPPSHLQLPADSAVWFTKCLAVFPTVLADSTAGNRQPQPSPNRAPISKAQMRGSARCSRSARRSRATLPPCRPGRLGAAKTRRSMHAYYHADVRRWLPVGAHYCRCSPAHTPIRCTKPSPAAPLAPAAHLCAHGEPVAAACVCVDLEAHVVRHIVLPHLHNALQRVL